MRVMNSISKNIRVIARLDVKGPNLVKSKHLEGLRVIGEPRDFAEKYYRAGADELIFIDLVASLYGRNSLLEILKNAAQDIFIPLTVGGGIRTVEDVEALLRAGADKIAINTMAVKRPALISEVANSFGSQCMVLSLECKKESDGKWNILIENGREKTGIDAIDWAKKGAEMGAGEILVTSIDKEGTRSGFDLELLNQISSAVSIPVIASGGFGRLDDFSAAVFQGKVDAVAIADAIHYNRMQISEIKEFATTNKINVRTT